MAIRKSTVAKDHTERKTAALDQLNRIENAASAQDMKDAVKGLRELVEGVLDHKAADEVSSNDAPGNFPSSSPDVAGPRPNPSFSPDFPGGPAVEAQRMADGGQQAKTDPLPGNPMVQKGVRPAPLGPDVTAAKTGKPEDDKKGAGEVQNTPIPTTVAKGKEAANAASVKQIQGTTTTKSEGP